MTKRWAVVLMLLFWGSSIARADAETAPTPAPIRVEAKAAILIERDSGRVLMEQNADKRYPMASTTKIMTAPTITSGNNIENKSGLLPSLLSENHCFQFIFAILRSLPSEKVLQIAAEAYLPSPLLLLGSS